MKKITLLIALILLLPAIAGATIIEETKMEKAISHADKDSLLIFDVDNTIMEPKQMLGSDQWYYYLIDKYINEGMDKQTATDRVGKLWAKVERLTEVIPVEKKTPEMIKTAKDNGFKVIALTARPTDIAGVTSDHLRSIGVDFSDRPAFAKNVSVGDGAEYIDGILFSGLSGDKGILLKKFLDRVGYKPRRVVFIDDRIKNVEAVDRSLSAASIDCICIRYGGADKKVRAFDPKVADIELEYIERPLSDDAARTILRSGNK